MKGLTVSRLKSLLNYDEKTGLFSRKDGQRIGYPRKQDGYISIKIDNIPHLAHRLAFFYMTGREPEGLLDHIDTNRSNNAWSNLREVNPQQSSVNRRNFGRFLKGVTARKGKFLATIGGQSNRQHLGTFETEAEAHEAYCRAAKERYGEFYNDGQYIEDKAA